jgi:hypothetical protein
MRKQLVGVDSATAQGFVRHAAMADSAEVEGRSYPVAVGWVMLGAVLGAGMLALVKREGRRAGYTAVA